MTEQRALSGRDSEANMQEIMREVKELEWVTAVNQHEHSEKGSVWQPNEARSGKGTQSNPPAK